MYSSAVDGCLTRVIQLATPRVMRRDKGEKTAGHHPGSPASRAGERSIASQLRAAMQTPVAPPMTAGATI
jgi:hypothetical protein